MNKIIQGDCIEELKKLEPNSVDAIVTDPPYNLDWKEPIKFKERKDIFHYKEKIEKWDTLDIKDFYKKIAKEFNRILKIGSSVIIFSRVENISYLKEAFLENNFYYKATIIWHKTNPTPQIRKKNYLSSFESVCWLVKGYSEKIDYTFNFKNQKEMHNFIQTPLCMGKERTKHPTQKPLRVIEHLIEIHTNKNDLVLDPFLGSGTTAIACLKLNRKFIGIEKEEEYVKIANARIKPFLEQEKL